MRVNNEFFDRERETVSSAQTVPADRVDILSCRRYLYYHFSVLSFSRKKLVFFSRCSTRDSTAEYIIVHIPEQARYMDVPFIVTALIQTVIFYFCNNSSWQNFFPLVPLRGKIPRNFANEFPE